MKAKPFQVAGSAGFTLEDLTYLCSLFGASETVASFLNECRRGDNFCCTQCEWCQ